MCSSGNGSGAGMKRLHRQPHHHRRVLADRVQHHRVLELGRHLADDVDALGLELLQMRQSVAAHAAPQISLRREPGHDEGTRLGHRRVSRVDGQLRVRRRLVGIGDARQVRELPGPSLRVEAFPIACLAGLERRGHVHEEKAAQRLDHAPHLSAGLIVGRYGRADGDPSVADDFRGDPPDAQHVQVAVFAREAELG